MSHWNPIESIKSATKEIKHFASDAATTGKNLFDDAYSTGKEAIKGASTVAKDTIHTVTESTSNLSHGDFIGAAKSVAHGAAQTNTDVEKATHKIATEAKHGLVDGVKGAGEMSGDLNHVAVDTATAINPSAGKALRITEAFGAAALNSAILQPIDAVSQLAGAGIHEATGYKLPDLKLHVTADTEGLGTAGKIATIAGSAAGYLAPMILTGGATSALAGIAVAGKAAESAAAVEEVASVSAKTASLASSAGKTVEAAASENPSKISSALTKYLDSPHKSTADGAIAGFTFTPSQDGRVDVAHRLQAAAINGAAFGSMTATARGVHQAGKAVAGSSVDGTGVASATETASRHTLSSVTGGIAGEETKSLTEGHGLATPHQLAQAANQMLVRHISSESADKARVSVLEAVK